MKKLFLIMLFFTVPAMSYGGFVACHNGGGVLVRPSSSTAICINYSIPPFSATDYDRVKNVLKTIPRKYIKWTTEPVEMTQGEKDAADIAEANARDLLLKIIAQELYDGQQEQGLAFRSLVKVLLDEINTLRTWIRDFKVETAGANNLANFKARVAGLPNLPDRTLSQAKSAIQGSISDGSVDE